MHVGLAQIVGLERLLKMTNNQRFEVIKDVSKLEIPEYIDKPEYVRNKSVGYGLLFAGWALWIWLFLPVLTIVFWWFEGSVIYQQLVLVEQQASTGLSLLNMAFIISALILTLWIWASYNWVRFSGPDRRKGLASLADEQLAMSFKLSVSDIEALHQSHNITLYYHENGLLEHYDLNDVKDDSEQKHA